MTIKKGDRLTLSVGGAERAVEALSDGTHGNVVVRDAGGSVFSASVLAFATCSTVKTRREICCPDGSRSKYAAGRRR